MNKSSFPQKSEKPSLIVGDPLESPLTEVLFRGKMIENVFPAHVSGAAGTLGPAEETGPSDLPRSINNRKEATSHE